MTNPASHPPSERELAMHHAHELARLLDWKTLDAVQFATIVADARQFLIDLAHAPHAAAPPELVERLRKADKNLSYVRRFLPSHGTFGEEGRDDFDATHTAIRDAIKYLSAQPAQPTREGAKDSEHSGNTPSVPPEHKSKELTAEPPSGNFAREGADALSASDWGKVKEVAQLAQRNASQKWTADDYENRSLDAAQLDAILTALSPWLKKQGEVGNAPDLAHASRALVERIKLWNKGVAESVELVGLAYAVEDALSAAASSVPPARDGASRDGERCRWLASYLAGCKWADVLPQWKPEDEKYITAENFWPTLDAARAAMTAAVADKREGKDA